MSYVSTPAGLQTVSVDGVTIEGDGTPSDPLVALPQGASAYSVGRAVYNGSLPGFIVPTTGFIRTDTAMTVQFNSGTDFDFAAGGVRMLNAGTYKLTLQTTIKKPLNNQNRHVQVMSGLSLALGGGYEVAASDSTSYNANTEGDDTVNLEYIVECVGGEIFWIRYDVTGTPYSLPDYMIESLYQQTYINVERVL